GRNVTGVQTCALPICAPSGVDDVDAPLATVPAGSVPARAGPVDRWRATGPDGGLRSVFDVVEVVPRRRTSRHRPVRFAVGCLHGGDGGAALDRPGEAT